MSMPTTIATATAPRTPTTATTAEPAPPVIALEGVARVYGRGDSAVHALRGVDLAIAPREFVAVMGTSGSGKSTLMNILGCLDAPTAGRYLLDGVDVAGLSADRKADVRNRTLGFVFQNYGLLPRTSAVDNVALPLLYAGVGRRAIASRAQAALARVGLSAAGRPPSQRAVGRPAATGRDRARHRHPPGGDPGRRADRQPRHPDQPRDHGAVPGAVRRGHHDRAGDPRARHRALRVADRGHARRPDRRRSPAGPADAAVALAALPEEPS
jgi:ABC-type glutathione transport system ATPase component